MSFSAFLSVCIMIIGILLFRLLKQKKVQEQKLDLYKKKQQELSEKLNLKNRELIAKSIHLTKKEHVLESVTQQLSYVHKDLSKRGVDDVNLRNAIRELSPENATNASKVLEKQLIEVNPEFYNLLGQKASLTPNERRICAFLRLNMSTKEISEVTQQSPRAIEVARHRLRKKLNLDRKDNLTSFMVQIT